MNPDTALARVDALLARYEGCDSRVLRIMSAVDLDAVKTLADMARSAPRTLAAEEG